MIAHHFRPVALLAALALAVLSGCASGNPYDYAIEPPLDTQELPMASAPERKPAATIMLLPPQNHTGATYAQLAASLNGDVRARISASANIDVRADEAGLRDLMNELAARGSPLYSAEGAAEIGRIRQAGYVAYLTLSAVATVTEPYRTWQYVNGQRVEVTNWASRASAQASLSVVSVETGVVVYEVSRSNQFGMSGYESPPDSRVEMEHARAAVAPLGTVLTAGLGGVFPVTGYISEMRGSQEWVLIDTGGRAVARGVVFRIESERMHNDPVRGLVTVSDPVGEVVAQVSDTRGVWARVRSGKPNLRKGMTARTSGAIRPPSFFEQMFG